MARRRFRMELLQHQDAMNVIGHDDERIQVGVGIVLGKCIPSRLNGPTGIRQPDLSLFDLAEKTVSAMSADRHEVPAYAAVVLLGKSDGLAVLPIRIEAHGHPPDLDGGF